MKYQVEYSAVFKRRIKKLSTKYPRIKQDLSNLIDQLEQGTFQGDKLQDYPAEVYKVRVGSIDQKKGKRGGFRVVYIFVTIDKTAYLAEIYPKAKQENLTEKQKQEIKNFIKNIRDQSS